MLLALKAGEIKRRSRFQRSPSEKKTPSIMPSAPWIKEPHRQLPGWQKNNGQRVVTFAQLEAQKMPGFTALKGRRSKILEVSGHEVKQTILVPALGLWLVGKSDACF